MSIVHLIVKQEMVLECKEKCNFSKNSSNVLYYGTLHLVTLNQYGHDLSKMVPSPGMLSH